MSELHSLRLVLAVARAATDPTRGEGFRAMALGRLALEIKRHDEAMRRPPRCTHEGCGAIEYEGGVMCCDRCGARLNHPAAGHAAPSTEAR